MRVLYEGAIFEIMPRGGIGRYVQDVVRRLPDSIEPSVMMPLGLDMAMTHPAVEIHAVRTKPALKLMRRFWRPAQHPRLDRLRERIAADVVHWTYYVGLCRRPIVRGSAPNVITVYDFIHEAFPELDPDGAHRRWKAEAIAAADHVCCISHTTHRELCERFPAVAPRTSVTPLGNGLADVEPVPPGELLKDRPFVLFVGRRGGYKNFQTLLSAWQRVRASGAELDLVVVGPPLKPREAAQRGIAPDADGFFHLGDVSDASLKGLYQASSAFVFPSQMEGFGLPALEAMDSGTPVIASGCAALREVIGEAGYFFNAEDESELTDLLTAVARDRLPDRSQMIRRGRERAAEFSWDRTVEQTVAAYEAVTGRGRTTCAA